MLPIECVVRGYLSGSGWKSYQQSGEVCGIALPEGLRESDKLPEPIFTPTTKATEGHDEALTAEQAADAGRRRAVRRGAQRISIELYAIAAELRPRARGSSSRTRSSSSASTTRGESSSATRSSRPTRRASGRPTSTSRAARSPRSTSSSSATTPSRSAGTRPRRAPSSRTRSSPAPARATSRRSSGSPGISFDDYAADPDEGAAVKATVLVRPKPGILDPQGKAVEDSFAASRLQRRRRAGRARSSTSRSRHRIPSRRAPRSSACAPSCSRTR